MIFARLPPVALAGHRFATDMTPDWAMATCRVASALLRPFGWSLHMLFSPDTWGRWSFVGFQLTRET